MRKKGPNESHTNPSRASKKGQDSHCGKCLQTGHNQRTCHSPVHPSSKMHEGEARTHVNKGGRPKKRDANGRPFQHSRQAQRGASGVASSQPAQSASTIFQNNGNVPF